MLTPPQLLKSVRQRRMQLNLRVSGVPGQSSLRLGSRRPTQDFQGTMPTADTGQSGRSAGTATEITRQIGNAVCVNLTAALITAILSPSPAVNEAVA
jgi:hypothetical protein